MMSTVLRVDGEEFDPDAFLAGCNMEPDRIHRRGERRSALSFHTTSGFTALVSDEDGTELATHIDSAIEFLQDYKEEILRLRADPKVTALLLDFGFGFPDRLAARYFRVPLPLLAACAELGVEIEFSVYRSQ
jgi:hypothetical protein